MSSVVDGVIYLRDKRGYLHANNTIITLEHTTSSAEEEVHLCQTLVNVCTQQGPNNITQQLEIRYQSDIRYHTHKL